MADPVDELEVLVSLDLGPLEDDLDDVIDEFQRLDDQRTDDAQDELDDLAESADDASESISDADNKDLDVDVDDGEVSQLRRRVEALDGRSVEINTDVDRDRLRGAFSGGGGSGEGIFGGNRLPGELDEVQEGITALSAVPPQLKAVGAAATAAAAALGAGAGLAGVATALAAELGPAGLKSDVQAARAEFKEVGRDFASAFSGVIRSEVLPAARGLAAAVRSADDALASFSGAALDFLKQFPGAGPAFGALVGAGRQGGSGRASVLQGTDDLAGLREIRKNLVDQIERVRERFKRDLIPKTELLSQIKSFRLDAVKNLQKLEQKFPEAFPDSVLDAFVAKLKQVKKQLEEIQGVSLEDVAPQPADAEQVEPAERESSGGSLSSTIQGLSLVPMGGTGGPSSLAAQARQTRREFFKIRQQIRASITQMSSLARVGVQAFTRLGSVIGSTVGKAFGGLIRGAVGLKSQISSIGDAFRSLGSAAISVLQQVIAKLASAAAIAAILGPVLGVSSAGFGGIFGSLIGGGAVPGLASGGLVTGQTFAMVGEGTEDEAVMPLSRLNGFIQQSAQLGAASVAGRVGTMASGGGSAGKPPSTRLEGGDVLIPGTLIDQARQNGSRDRNRTGRKV